MRTITHGGRIRCETSSITAYRVTEGEVRVDVCGPSDNPGGQFAAQEEVVVFYLSSEDGEWDDAEFTVRLDDLRQALDAER